MTRETLAERYIESAQAVVRAMSDSGSLYKKSGSSAYKALLSPQQFHDEVYRLTCTAADVDRMRSALNDVAFLIEDAHGRLTDANLSAVRDAAWRGLGEAVDADG